MIDGETTTAWAAQSFDGSGSLYRGSYRVSPRPDGRWAADRVDMEMGEVFGVYDTLDEAKKRCTDDADEAGGWVCYTYG